jgi:hypothetical protein
MEHAEAVENQAVERYLLEELTAAEVDSFEEHYFDCAECAEDLRAGAALLDGGRTISERPSETRPSNIEAFPPPARRSSHRATWLAAAATAILLFGLGGSYLMRRDASPAFEVMQEAPAYLTVSRSAENVVTLRGDQSAVRFVDIPATGDFASYELRLLGPGGKVVGQSAVTTEQATDSVPVVLRGLEAAAYEVVIEGLAPGGERTRIAAIPFTVRRP